MTTLMRSAAVVAVSFFVAFGTVGCDDVSGGGGGGTTTTTQAPASTTTTTMGATTTTTTGATTTTTIGGGNALTCVVTWSVTNAVTLGALQFDTDYSSASGDFEGSADQVVCSDQTGSLSSFNDNEATRTLSAGFISIAGFAAPTDVLRCNFNTPTGDLTDPVAGDFGINVVDATDPNLNPVSATVAITDITCTPTGGGTTTTLAVTTTTTGGTTTTVVGGTAFTIGFDLADAVNVGALQFDVDYSGAPGGFDGAADAVACTDQTGSLASFNDNEGASRLSAGFINLGGFAGPTTVATCSFTSTGTAPVPGDFALTVVDAAAPDLTPIAPLPTMNVTVAAQ